MSFYRVSNSVIQTNKRVLFKINFEGFFNNILWKIENKLDLQFYVRTEDDFKWFNKKKIGLELERGVKFLLEKFLFSCFLWEVVGNC